MYLIVKTITGITLQMMIQPHILHGGLHGGNKREKKLAEIQDGRQIYPSKVYIWTFLPIVMQISSMLVCIILLVFVPSLLLVNNAPNCSGSLTQ